MAESDWLVRMSDGVVEATNVKGELFGFERVLELVRSRPSATQMRKPRKPSVRKATSA